MELTSVDYARLLSWIAYFRFGQILGKVQQQKLLYILYGLYLAKYNQPLFTDDTPKVWPYGPVFPRSYKRFFEGTPQDFGQADREAYATNLNALPLATKVVSTYSSYSATQLSDWSHRDANPWAKTLQKAKRWNVEIPQEDISVFFDDENVWRRGLH